MLWKKIPRWCNNQGVITVQDVVILLNVHMLYRFKRTILLAILWLFKAWFYDPNRSGNLPW
jgi:hypothetical protein